MNLFEGRLQADLRRKKEQGLFRKTVPVQCRENNTMVVARHAFINLAGNDYLGLAADTALLEEFYSGLSAKTLLNHYGQGSGASRLMTGNHSGYQQFEKNLAAFYHTEKALVFNSGYHINIGLLPALAGKDDLIIADKLCHASLIDGLRLSRAKVIRYPHLDYRSVEGLLGKYQGSCRTIFVVSESIFSMDGDCADIARLVRLKEEYNAVLYLDEAHAVGLRGNNGLGLAEEQGVADRVDLLVGTFGKAWAGQGAFVACSEIIHDFLVNHARSLIYTTALPRISLHWLDFLLPKIKAMHKQRRQLAQSSNRLRNALFDQGLTTGGESHIIPVLIGEADKAVAVAELLRQHGFWINAVRPPTVPQNSSRLRISLTANLTDTHLEPLPGLIAETLAAL
jgi:8-amino-7-oxononanoate synthase